MSGPEWLGIVLIIGIVAFALYARHARRPGETFEHAYERILNTDGHKERERMRQAGLLEDAKADPPPRGEGPA